mmetsp:Transcript_16728/g.29613  ORF Transcript_16728/g.29613 Transcript_16728/m.29613 type:complete len:138 (-) Transcript_16728:329-742(-)
MDTIRSWIDSGTSEREAAEYTESVELGLQTNCVEHFDEMMYCFSPGHQFKNYYYYGSVDVCEKVRQNFVKCLSLKTNKTAQEKADIIKEIDVQAAIPPSSQIWSFKENPKEDWNPSTSNDDDVPEVPTSESLTQPTP